MAVAKWVFSPRKAMRGRAGISTPGIPCRASAMACAALQRLHLPLGADPVVEMRALFVPEVLGHHLEVHGRLPGQNQQHLLGAAHGQPVAEVAVGAERGRLVVGIVVAGRATVNEHGLEIAGGKQGVGVQREESFDVLGVVLSEGHGSSRWTCVMAGR
jgi:hypothetical protein